jgi:hypothetical protein
VQLCNMSSDSGDRRKGSAAADALPGRSSRTASLKLNRLLPLRSPSSVSPKATTDTSGHLVVLVGNLGKLTSNLIQKNKSTNITDAIFMTKFDLP